MSHTGVAVGMREPVTVSHGRTVGRPSLSNWPLAQLSAAPIPRFGSVWDESVCRVPKPTSVSIVCRSCAWLTGATIARSLASVDGGGAAPIRLTHIKIAIFRIRLSPDPPAATGIWRGTGLGERQPRTSKLRRVYVAQYRPFHRRLLLRFR